MKLWKMSIKTGGQKGDQAFLWCRERGIIGVGWSCVYEGRSDVPIDALTLLTGEHKRGVSPVRMVIQRIQVGDLVCLHHRGDFYLCRIVDPGYLAGPQVGEGFNVYDVGHARRAEWVQVPEDLVPGVIQRAVISRRMVFRIPCTERLADYCMHIHASLKSNPQWRPEEDRVSIRSSLDRLSRTELGEAVSPDDWEDIVAAYLQGQGWVLVKSSCFPTKPRFECRLIREDNGFSRTAFLQVKSGQVCLRPEEYADAAKSATVFLFSTRANDPYPGPAILGVEPISFSTIRAWMSEHVMLLPLSLRAQLCFVAG